MRSPLKGARLMALSVAMLGAGLGGLLGEAVAPLLVADAGSSPDVLHVHTHPAAQVAVDGAPALQVADVVDLTGLALGPHVMVFTTPTTEYAYRVWVGEGEQSLALNLGADPLLGTAEFVGMAAR